MVSKKTSSGKVAAPVVSSPPSEFGPPMSPLQPSAAMSAPPHSQQSYAGTLPSLEDIPTEQGGGHPASHAGSSKARPAKPKKSRQKSDFRAPKATSGTHRATLARFRNKSAHRKLLTPAAVQRLLMIAMVNEQASVVWRKSQNLPECLNELAREFTKTVFEKTIICAEHSGSKRLQCRYLKEACEILGMKIY